MLVGRNRQVNEDRLVWRNAAVARNGFTLIASGGSVQHNSCNVCRANCIRYYSNTGIPGRRESRKEKFVPGPAPF
jgi:hypothetical protein